MNPESGNVEMRRSWLLPVLGRVKNTQHPGNLDFLADRLLTLADRAVIVAQHVAAHSVKSRAIIVRLALRLAQDIWRYSIGATLSGLACSAKASPLGGWGRLRSSGLGRRLACQLISAPALTSCLLRAITCLATQAARHAALVGASDQSCGIGIDSGLLQGTTTEDGRPFYSHLHLLSKLVPNLFH
ncbi:unnamed protein product [Protopolystoma xenopodis]|uniref:Uncharacterized protein n=1 Tax=Protopolystoma xenopodis TaxID=117903 RepID=A0A3S5CQ18_9PLAT|nr:unnamed protein product [Protopolystoma xenopodis]